MGAPKCFHGGLQARQFGGMQNESLAGDIVLVPEQSVPRNSLINMRSARFLGGHACDVVRLRDHTESLILEGGADF